MFGDKAYRIKELKRIVEELKDNNVRLIRENQSLMLKKRNAK